MLLKDSFSVKVLSLSIVALKRLEQGETLDVLLDDYRGQEVGKTVADLLFNYFRNKALIDYHILLFTKKNGSKKSKKGTPAKFKRIIAVALTQAKFQTGIESHVAVDVAVGYAKKKYGKSISGFINAVLRKSLDADNDDLKNQAGDSVRLNIPPSVLDRWKKDFSKKEIAGFAQLFTEKASLTFRLLQDIPENEIENAGCTPVIVPDWGEGVRFYETSNPEVFFKQNWLEQGKVYIQDLSTVSPCMFFKPGKTDVVYDLCSAPGGKSLLLHERMHLGVLVAADVSVKRQKRTIENLQKSSNTVPYCVIAGSALKPGLKPENADCVLIDVPCTNTGVFRRRPDALWNFNAGKLAELTVLQASILKEAACLVKTGGVLIYSTCSIEREENDQQVENFLSKNPSFNLVAKRILLPSVLHDGGFSALLKKN